MTAVDFKRELPAYRARRGRFDVIDVPALQYLMIDGHGDPNTSPQFSAAVSTLYPLAYGLKFAARRELGRDHVVMPLEGLWWSADMAAFTTRRDKDDWDWTLMIMQPSWVDEDLFTSVVDAVAAKSPPRIAEVRLETLAEGRCVQTLHLGPFDDEAPVLEHLHRTVIPEHGLALTGKHHEIYLSDARRTAPERRRTILRQPVTTD